MKRKRQQSIKNHTNLISLQGKLHTKAQVERLTNLKRPAVVGWMGPANLRAAAAVCGVKYAAKGGNALLLLGLLANLTVIGSVYPFGIVPFNSFIAFSASWRWSKRMNPTPFDKP